MADVVVYITGDAEILRGQLRSTEVQALHGAIETIAQQFYAGGASERGVKMQICHRLQVPFGGRVCCRNGRSVRQFVDPIEHYF